MTHTRRIGHQLREQLRIYLVVDPDVLAGDLIDALEKSIAGGVSIVQLRAKHRTDREILELAAPIRRSCDKAGVPFIMNDRVDLAIAARANGVHLGVDDLPLEEARRLGGLGFIIGYSPETDGQIGSAAERGANYLGVGPVFATTSKEDAGNPLGLVEFSRRRGQTSLLTVGIGGIAAGNAASVIEAGADGIAVVSAILRADDPRDATAKLLTVISRQRKVQEPRSSSCSKR